MLKEGVICERLFCVFLQNCKSILLQKYVFYHTVGTQLHNVMYNNVQIMAMYSRLMHATYIYIHLYKP